MGAEANRTRKGADIYTCLAVFLTVTVIAMLVRRSGSPLAVTLSPVLWGLGSVLHVRPGEKARFFFGLTGADLTRNLRYFILSSLIVFPLYALGFLLYARHGIFAYEASPLEGVPVYSWLLHTFLAAALFEEMFFRGFVQGRFENYTKGRFRRPAVTFWVPIVVSALLFALAHWAVYLDPPRLLVFFPGLLFGWLRAKTGSLLACILSHGVANSVSILLMGAVS
jgi:membrane protease YdiL (CAAX protease family)